MRQSMIMCVDARVELPVETAVLFSVDPTKETPSQEALMKEVPGAEQMFPAGTVAAGPVLDIHLEGEDASVDLSVILVDLDGSLAVLMNEFDGG